MGDMLGWPVPPTAFGMRNMMNLALTELLCIPILLSIDITLSVVFVRLSMAHLMDALIALGSSAVLPTVWSASIKWQMPLSQGIGQLLA